jgi:fermentation-respiration switch protein FrsA (DUF1100 family)
MPIRKPRFTIRRLASFLLLIIILTLMLHWFEHANVYHPQKHLDAEASALRRPFEDVYFQTADGTKLNGWYFPANTNSAKSDLAVLLCHGNAGNISHRLELSQALLDAGVAVFVFDYRGYGHSDGRPTEKGTYQDAEAAYQWLRQKGFPSTNIIAFGESLGGGVASELAMRHQLGGLVLESSFTSIPDVGSEIFPWLPVRLLGTIHYNTCERLPRINAPVLVMHSREDTLVRFTHAERNYAAARDPKLLWEYQGSHCDCIANPAHFLKGFNQFLTLLPEHVH